MCFVENVPKVEGYKCLDHNLEAILRTQEMLNKPTQASENNGGKFVENTD